MKTHHGSCHCGAVTFTVNADIEKAITCNCSYCHRKGMVLAFVSAEQFTLNSGEDNLTEYRFNKKKIAHLFCKTCGVQSFGRSQNQEGKDMLAINVRCIPEVDIDALQIDAFNGKDY